MNGLPRLARFLRSQLHTTSRRLQAHGEVHTEAPVKAFNNKYNFNTNPPPVHEYWSTRNVSILLAFIPVYLTVSYFTKYGTSNAEGYEGLLQYAKGENSPMKNMNFAEPQLKGKED